MFEEEICREMRWASEAQDDGNAGRARVCARRAVGYAIRAYFANKIIPEGYGKDAIHDLRRLATDESVPQPIRHIAVRLVARVTEPHERTVDPLADGWTLIEFLLPVKQNGEKWR